MTGLRLHKLLLGILTTAAGATLLLMGGLFLGTRWLHRWVVPDFSRVSAPFAYRKVLRRELPTQVEDFRAAGWINWGGSTVWLRFKATPEIVHDLSLNLSQVPRAQIVRVWEATEPSSAEASIVSWNRDFQPSKVHVWEDDSYQTRRLIWDPGTRVVRYYYWTQ